MAANKNQEKIGSLTAYAERIKSALSGAVPAKHKDSEAGWRQFMEIDLKKTLAKIEELKTKG